MKCAGRSSMKLSTLAFLSLLALPACSGADASPVQDPAAPPADGTAEADASKGITFTCTEDKAREDKYDKNRFASLTLVLTGKKVTLKNIVYTADFKQGLTQEQSNSNDYLAKGVEYDGKTPLTAQDRADTKKRMDEVDAILGADGKLAFSGTIKPYVRAPKKPTVQYPLETTTAGIDEATLWDTLGNEGDGARLLLPPAMATGAAGKPDIEFEGTQGPVWDRFDCTK